MTDCDWKSGKQFHTREDVINIENNLNNRWKAAVEEIRRLAEEEATPYEPVHPSKYFNQFARMLLTRMEAS